MRLTEEKAEKLFEYLSKIVESIDESALIMIATKDDSLMSINKSLELAKTNPSIDDNEKIFCSASSALINLVFENDTKETKRSD